MTRPRAVGECRWDLASRDPDPWGVVGVGADLEPATLVHAYRHGIFPWPHGREPLPWFSPDPRAVITAKSLHISRSLASFMKKSRWTTTLDRDFRAVVAACGRARKKEGTWITREMIAAYARLHELGWAHSVEVWSGERLVGGIYGVQVGGVFTGESMFHLEPNASKVALVDLVRRISAAGGACLDAQLPTPHLERMGARAITRRKFLELLEKHRDAPVTLPSEERRVDLMQG